VLRASRRGHHRRRHGHRSASGCITGAGAGSVVRQLRSRSGIAHSAAAEIHKHSVRSACRACGSAQPCAADIDAIDKEDFPGGTVVLDRETGGSLCRPSFRCARFPDEENHCRFSCSQSAFGVRQERRGNAGDSRHGRRRRGAAAQPGAARTAGERRRAQAVGSPPIRLRPTR